VDGGRSHWADGRRKAALWTSVIDGFTAVAAERIQADRAGGLAPERDDDPRVLAGVLCWMNERAWYLAAAGHAGFTDALTEVWEAAIYGNPGHLPGASPPEAADLA
jgi:hypothetical protein